MSGLLLSPSPSHCFRDPASNPQAGLDYPSTLEMGSNKRKAEDDLVDDRMSSSPTPSAATLPHTSRPQAPLRTTKRLRTNLTGRPLPLPRLLETLSAEDMRTVLSSICARHPSIGAEIVSTAPRPTVASTLAVLTRYQETLQESFPYGNQTTSDYSYNRVRQPLQNLLDALKEYTPHFLPPNEVQAATSLQFLDGATHVIHRLPNWDSYLHNRHKDEAYEDISRAWAFVIREAAKKGGGIQMQYGGWDQKLAKHDEASGGKLGDAMRELQSSLGWIAPAAGAAAPGASSTTSGSSEDAMSIRQQLLSGTYGAIQVGPW